MWSEAGYEGDTWSPTIMHPTPHINIKMLIVMTIFINLPTVRAHIKQTAKLESE